MAFHPPKTQAFRRFVMLDAPSILAALSALDGGAVDEILTRRVDESGHDFGGQVSVPMTPVKAKAKRGKSQRVEEELRQVRTEHSAASALIDGLKQRDAVGTLDGALDAETLEQISPGMVIELSAHVVPHPLFQLDTLIRSYLKVAPKMGQGKEAQELRKVLPLFHAISGTGDDSPRVLFDLDTGESQIPRVVAFASRPSLQVGLEDITGKFSSLAQVDEILVDPVDELFSMRLVRGAPPAEAERTAIREGTQLLQEAAAGMGVQLRDDDLVMSAPVVVLRPLCIWR